MSGNNLKRFLCFAFAAVLMFSQYASAYEFSKVTVAKSNNDYAMKCAEIVNSYSGASGKTTPDAADCSLRIIGKASDRGYNFASYNAKACVVAEDGRFLMQFSSFDRYSKALSKLSADPAIIYAEPDSKITTSSESETKAVSWSVACLGLDKYSEKLSADSDLEEVTVAIVDTGASYIEPLKDRLVNGYDFIGNDTDAFQDESSDSHGTFLAGIVAGCTENTKVKIMPVRVIKSKTGYVSTAVNGIHYAADNGAKVINISLSGPIGGCSAIDDALAYVESKDAVAVVCSGNFSKDTSEVCPAHIESAITVSAIDNTCTFVSSFSDYGEAVDVCAPGYGIISYGADGNEKALSGTSMSAAFISAGAALLRMQNPELNSAEVQQKIKKSCLDLGEEGFDIYYGYGLPQFDYFNEEVGGGEGSEDGNGNEDNPVIPDDPIIPEDPVVPEDPELVGISIKTPPSKIEYTYKTDKSLDISGLVLELVYSDGGKETVTDLSEVTVSGYDSGKVGEQKITLKYKDFTADYSIIVGYAWWQWIIRILFLGFLWY